MLFTEQEEIESVSFAARANIASDLNTFLEVITAHPAVESLQKRLRVKSDIDDLVKLMLHLCNLTIDKRYENPWDSALATYAWILTKVDPEREDIAIHLLRKLKNSWWSSHLAERFLEQR